MKIKRSQLKQLIKEELLAILNEQGFPQGIAQDIPTDGPKPEPPRTPAVTRTGQVLTPERLSDLGFETAEEYFEQNPEYSPDYALSVDRPEEPEPIQRYGGYIPMGERGATILRQTGQDL